MILCGGEKIGSWGANGRLSPYIMCILYVGWILFAVHGGGDALGGDDGCTCGPFLLLAFVFLW